MRRRKPIEASIEDEDGSNFVPDKSIALQLKRIRRVLAKRKTRQTTPISRTTTRTLILTMDMLLSPKHLFLVSIRLTMPLAA